MPGGPREPDGVHLPVAARGQEQAALRPQARALRPLPAAREVPPRIQLPIQPEVGSAVEAGVAAGVPLLHQWSDPGESKFTARREIALWTCGNRDQEFIPMDGISHKTFQRWTFLLLFAFPAQNLPETYIDLLRGFAAG